MQGCPQVPHAQGLSSFTAVGWGGRLDLGRNLDFSRKSKAGSRVLTSSLCHTWAVLHCPGFVGHICSQILIHWGCPRWHREPQPQQKHGCQAAREVTALGTWTEGTHPLGSTHTKGAHPCGPPETPSPPGTTTHSLPVCPRLGTL